MEKIEMKNKKSVIVISMLIVLTVVVIGTYALWQITEKQSNRNVVGTTCLNITFGNESGDIDLQNAWPTTDADGANLAPYTFTITNNCTESVNYSVALESITDTVNNNTNYLDYSFIKVKIDNEEPAIYGDLNDLTNDTPNDYEVRATKELAHHTLAGGASATHEFRLWIDNDTPLQNEDESYNTERYFFGKIKVIAGQNIEGDNPREACFTIDNEGTITGYDLSCGFAVTIPATVRGIPVKKIAAETFAGEDYEMNFDFLSSMTRDRKSIISINFSINVFRALIGEDVTITPNDIWIVKYQDVDVNDYFSLNGIYYNIQYIVRGYDAENDLIDEDDWEELVSNLTFDMDDIAVYNNDSLTPDSPKPDLAFIRFENYQDNTTVFNNEYRSLFVENLEDYPPIPGSYVFETDISKAKYLEEIEDRSFDASYVYGFFDAVSLRDTGDARFFVAPSEDIIIPDRITNLGHGVFSRYTGYTGTVGEYASITLNTGLKTIGGIAFANYKGTNQTLIIPDTVTTIGDSAFGSFNGTSLTLGNSVQTIGYSAFSDYVGTGQALIIPDSVRTIGNNAFRYYNGSDLNLGTGVEKIDLGAFISYVGTGQTLVIPSSVTTIGYRAFDVFTGDIEVYGSLCSTVYLWAPNAASCTAISN